MLDGVFALVLATGERGWAADASAWAAAAAEFVLEGSSGCALTEGGPQAGGGCCHYWGCEENRKEIRRGRRECNFGISWESPIRVVFY